MQDCSRQTSRSKNGLKLEETDKTNKFLSYNYNAKKNTFSVRPKVNWSDMKRGARKSPDVKNVEELQEHLKENGMTRRSVASVLMGSLHDPLQLMSPFINNLKLAYRDIYWLKIPWDEKVPENIISRIIEELNYFFKIETVEFQWKAVFSEADEVRFKIYFYGSKEMIGISVVVRSNFPNKKVAYRLLCNKSRLVADDITTAPHSELCACLLFDKRATQNVPG